MIHNRTKNYRINLISTGKFIIPYIEFFYKKHKTVYYIKLMTEQTVYIDRQPYCDHTVISNCSSHNPIGIIINA